MAVIFLEGFDKYGPPGQKSPDVADLMVQGEWTSHGGVASWGIVAGLSRTGYAFDYGGGTDAWVAKTLPNNYPRLIGGIRFAWVFVGGWGPIIQFQDSTTPQVSIRLDPDGRITIIRGGFAPELFGGGTFIETSDASISEGTTHYLEWDITFATSGAYQLWLDGISIMNNTGNTQNTGSAQATRILIGNNVGLTGRSGMFVDDLYLFDDSGSVNNAALLVNPRVETRFPNSDVQTQFSNVASLLGTSNAATNNTDAPGANTLFLRKFTSSVNQTIHSVSCVPRVTNGTAKFAAVLYDDSAGSPGALLSDGTEIIGTTNFAALESNLTTPTALTASTDYWIGFITDSSIILQESDSNTTLGQKAGNTYTSGAPDPAPAMAGAQPDWNIWGNCASATTNWESVSQNPIAGDLSCIASVDAGDEDLYGVPNLNATDADIYAIGVKASFKRSDTGPRTVDIRLKSGGTDSAGTNSGITGGTSYNWHDTYFDQDPDGTVDWTLTSANAIQIGPKIAT